MLWHGHEMPVVDTHADSLLAALKGQRHLYEASQEGQLDFPRMKQAGHKLQFLSCWVEPEFKPERALPRLLTFVDQFYTEVEAASSDVVHVFDKASLDRVLSSDKIGVVMSIEGSEAVGTDPRLVRVLYRLGFRLMSLTWNERNALADGAGEDPGGGGVSRAGRLIIQEINRIGMVLDVSHLSHAAFWDVMEISQRPVIASHSNCRALADHRRNLTDAQILALARHGGIQGLTFVREFLGGAQDVDRVVDHAQHHLDLVGDDRHLGLGSDFDGVEKPVTGLEDVTRLSVLADRMSDRGIPDETIERIFGGNYLRFFLERWSDFNSNT
ncbi:dipeptidase [Sulfobacillus thermosulfidooxidans]|uniref:dipeptidase n=1 Tax=Sulfobacillus thermosulfidooxidans TaxID=28034 RepID=UPI00178CCA79|nr:membrane dipeptidase [Sulfobacillus thermosulfidooxidans]